MVLNVRLQARSDIESFGREKWWAKGMGSGVGPPRPSSVYSEMSEFHFCQYPLEKCLNQTLSLEGMAVSRLFLSDPPRCGLEFSLRPRDYVTRSIKIPLPSYLIARNSFRDTLPLRAIWCADHIERGLGRPIAGDSGRTLRTLLKDYGRQA